MAKEKKREKKERLVLKGTNIAAWRIKCGIESEVKVLVYTYEDI